MGFPENEWHGHDLTTLVEGCAQRMWGRLKDVPPWEEVAMVDRRTVKEAILANIIDVLDVIHEHELALHSPESINCRFFTGDRNAVHELTSCIECESLAAVIGAAIVKSSDLDGAIDEIVGLLPKTTVIPASNWLLDRLLADLESVLSEQELSGEENADRLCISEVKALVADARNDYKEV